MNRSVIWAVAGVVGWASTAAAYGARAVEGCRVTASGQAQVEAQPDYVEIDMQVQAQAPTVPPAKGQVDEAVSRVLGAMRDAKLPEEAVSAGRITIQPQYDQPQPPYQGTGRLQGYLVTRDVVVKLRELARVGEVIDAATQAGANSITAVTYRLDEAHETQAVMEAQRLALDSARQQAKSAAQQAGARLGKAVTINLSSPPFRMARAAAMMARAGAASEYEPGPLTVSGQVSAEFELLYPGKAAYDEGASAAPTEDEAAKGAAKEAE